MKGLHLPRCALSAQSRIKNLISVIAQHRKTSREKLPRHQFIGEKSFFMAAEFFLPCDISAISSTSSAASEKTPDCFSRTIGNFPFTKTTQPLGRFLLLFRNRFLKQKNFNMFSWKCRRQGANGRWLRSCTKENLQT